MSNDHDFVSLTSWGAVALLYVFILVMQGGWI
jgi:hypothetical protein